MTDSTNNERLWGAVQVRQSDSFWVEFTAVPSPATPPAAGEPRSVEEALGMWMIKHHRSASITRYESVETDGVLTQLRVYFGSARYGMSQTSMRYGSREVRQSARVYEYKSPEKTELIQPRSVTTYAYDGGAGKARDVVEQDEQPPIPPFDDPAKTAQWLARLDRFTIQISDSFGRKATRTFLANHVDPSHTPAQRYDAHYRKFHLMENAIDQVSGLLGNWALMSAVDRQGNHTDYIWDDGFGVVRVAPHSQEDGVQFSVPPGHGLLRQTDPASGAIRHRVEPIQKSQPLS